jgi:hypothetical protein
MVGALELVPEDGPDTTTVVALALPGTAPEPASVMGSRYAVSLVPKGLSEMVYCTLATQDTEDVTVKARRAEVVLVTAIENLVGSPTAVMFTTAGR